jgi:hypothetical protein
MAKVVTVSFSMMCIMLEVVQDPSLQVVAEVLVEVG